MTKFSPKYLAEGTNTSILPIELLQKKNTKQFRRRQKKALENSIKYHKYNKELFDRNRKNHNFQMGEPVYVENGNRLNRKKLDELRIGPYKIEEKASESIYRINTGHKKAESNLFHVSKLIPVQNSTHEDKM